MSRNRKKFIPLEVEGKAGLFGHKNEPDWNKNSSLTEAFLSQQQARAEKNIFGVSNANSKKINDVFGYNPIITGKDKENQNPV